MHYPAAFFFYTAAIKISDGLAVVAAWYLCWYLRFSSDLIPAPKGLPEFDYYSKVSLPLMLVFSAIFHIVGAYRRDRVHFGFRALKKLAQSAIIGMLVFIAFAYFMYQVNYSRLFLIMFVGILVGLLVVERAVLHLGWNWFESWAIRPIRTLLVGGGPLMQMYVDQIREIRPYPVEWIGQLCPKDLRVTHIPWLGDESRLERTVENQGPNNVIVSYPTARTDGYTEILEKLSDALVDVKVVPDFGKYNTFSYSAHHECGIPLLAFNQTPTGVSDRMVKRCFDFCGSILLLILFLPVMLLIALLVRLSSPGPIFYSQERMGIDGKVFTLYKFRSMRMDAETSSGAVWATQNDNRTTAFGKWIRRTSLDELPQLFNVLRGDMSLVGPRPERPVFVRQFRKNVPKYMLRHKMKSGITGWAQVNGWRGNTSIEERINHDLYYIGNWSHFFDFKILCLTATRGFVNRHAY